MSIFAKLGLSLLDRRGAGRAPSPAAEAVEDDAAAPVDPRLALGAEPRSRPAGWRPVSTAEVRALYERPDSFLDLLPWVDYLPQEQTFLLEDGHSRAVLFELIAAKPQQWFQDIHARVEGALCNAVPEEDPAWILQTFLQDDPHAPRRLPAQLREYARCNAVVTPVTEAVCSALGRHLDTFCRPQGLFKDEQVTGMTFRGKRRTLRAVLYRRSREAHPCAGEAINEVAARFAATLEALGIRARRCDGHDLYDWLLPWFTPRPSFADGDPAKILAEHPRPGFEAGDKPRRPFVLPYGRDLAEWLVHSHPVSDCATRSWWFDGLPHAVVSVNALTRAPEVGALSAERRQGQHLYALFDRMPEATIMSMTVTVTVRPQDEMKLHLQRLINGSRAGSAEAEQTHHDAQLALRLLSRNHKLYPTCLAFYLRGDDLEQLAEHRRRAEAVLNAHGLKPITQEADLLGLDTYIRALPMAFDPEHDRHARRARLQFSYDLAALLPVYGRARGTDHPGFVFYNRGGEPLLFDPLSQLDRNKNAHLVLLGPIGAGKSATLVYLVLLMVAIHRPRIYLIEAGNSFGLLLGWLAKRGLSTNQVRIQPSSPVSLCPFIDAQRLLDQPRARLSEPDEGEEPPPDADEGIDEERDLLGEMELAARIMITGGEEKEDAKLSRADRFRIRAAIHRAAELSLEAGRSQTLTRDVVAALRELAELDAGLTERQRERLGEMADALALFTQGVEGAFFDREGEPWPDVDVTHLDLALYAHEGYSDKLVVSMVGLFHRINNLAERHQYDPRPTLVIVDESHVLTTNPLLAPFLAKIVKMWRKLGTWLWLATQNMQDFPDSARKLLNIVEWWLLLSMPKEEVEEVARFRQLTEEQRELMLSATKDPGRYVEGVVLSDRVQALFRSVVPAIALALAQTEKHEKAARARLMRSHGIDELEAAELIAAAIEAARAQAGAGP